MVPFFRVEGHVALGGILGLLVLFRCVVVVDSRHLGGICFVGLWFEVWLPPMPLLGDNSSMVSLTVVNTICPRTMGTGEID